MFRSNHRYIPIGNPQMQEQVLQLVASGHMEAVTLENGQTAYQLTPLGIAASKPYIDTRYNLTPAGRIAVAMMKANDQ